jgi:hypothetical protein
MESNTAHYNDEEIKFRDLINKVREYWNELWKNWLLIGLFCILFLVYFMYKHFKQVPEYKADLTYMLNTNDDNSLTGFASVLGSFGLNRSSRGFSMDKLVELSRSRAILQNTLLNKVEIDSKEDYFANIIIDLYDYHKEWEEDHSELDGFYFTHEKVDSFTNEENYVLKKIYSQIIGDVEDGIPGLMNSSYDEDSGILTLSFQSISEDLSVEFVKSHFEELKDFFINKTIEKQKLNFEIMNHKTDSLYGELREAEFDLANFKDTNIGIYTKKDNLTVLRLEGKIRMLYAGLGKALENREIADFTLKYQTPFIQTIDSPIRPLGIIASSLLLELIKSLLLGGLIASAFVFLRKLYRDSMRA